MRKGLWFYLPWVLQPGEVTHHCRSRCGYWGVLGTLLMVALCPGWWVDAEKEAQSLLGRGGPVWLVAPRALDVAGASKAMSLFGQANVGGWGQGRGVSRAAYEWDPGWVAPPAAARRVVRRV